MLNTTSQKILIYVTFIGAIFYALGFAGLMGFFPPPSPNLPAQDILMFYSVSPMQFRSGVVLMVLSGAFYLPWAIVVAVQMARLERGVPIWAITLALGSVLGTWLFAFPATLWGVAAFSVERAPALTLLMHEFAWLSFVAPTTYFILQTIPVAIVSLTCPDENGLSAFPRWVGWLTVWTCLGALVGVFAFMTKTGPFAWNGVFAFYLPLVIFSAWMTAMTVCMLKAINRQAVQAASNG